MIFTFFTPYSDLKFKINEVNGGYHLSFHNLLEKKPKEKLYVHPSEILKLLDFLELADEDDVLSLSNFCIHKYPIDKTVHIGFESAKTCEVYQMFYPQWVMQGTARVAFTILSRKEKLPKVQQELRGVV